MLFVLFLSITGGHSEVSRTLRLHQSDCCVLGAPIQSLTFENLHQTFHRSFHHSFHLLFSTDFFLLTLKCFEYLLSISVHFEACRASFGPRSGFAGGHCSGIFPAVKHHQLQLYRCRGNVQPFTTENAITRHQPGRKRCRRWSFFAFCS